MTYSIVIDAILPAFWPSHKVVMLKNDDEWVWPSSARIIIYIERILLSTLFHQWTLWWWKMKSAAARSVPCGIWFSIEVGDTEEFASVLPLTLQASVRHNRWRKMPSNLSPDKTKIECLWRDYGITPISCNITLFKNRNILALKSPLRCLFFID